MEEMKSMSNLGIFASQFEVNSKTLKEFDDAIRSMRRKKEPESLREERNCLLDVIELITESLDGNLSVATKISEGSVTDIIKERHSINWPTYRKKILQLKNKLRSIDFELEEEDFNILEDIADAIDAECQNLFQRMSER